jgi:hypothetical protein
LPVAQTVAQRAALQPIRHPIRLIVGIALATATAIGGLAAGAGPVDAASPKVVIVVGPVGSSTASYISRARSLAAQARSYGARVYEIYTPNATWARVRQYAQGANLLIYLGHGNGSPSPYGPLNRYKMNGLGLNPYAGSGNVTTSYYGEYYVARDIDLAANAVVILNHLCYASGNSEPGHSNPTLSVARQRVDNFGAGFLRSGARAVFAYGHSSASSILYSLFKTNRTMLEIFWSDPNETAAYRSNFHSARTPGNIGILDPERPGAYYRSIVGNGNLQMTAATWR